MASINHHPSGLPLAIDALKGAEQPNAPSHVHGVVTFQQRPNPFEDGRV